MDLAIARRNLEETLYIVIGEGWRTSLEDKLELVWCDETSSSNIYSLESLPDYVHSAKQKR
jgi:hypothetical protein